jgi:hypothetical protein
MKNEALKLALEALETELAVDMTNGAEVGEAAELMCEAIIAIKQALAAQPAVQEPVATVTSESGNPDVTMSWWHEPPLPVGTNLYTTPPAQRQWVGLTDAEVMQTMSGDWTSQFYFARAIETKLKEKNT